MRRDKIYYDLTSIARMRPIGEGRKQQTATGIQRTVWEVGKALHTLRRDVTFICFDSRSQLYWYVDAKQLFSQCDANLAAAHKLLGRVRRQKAHPKYAKRPLARAFHGAHHSLRSVLSRLSPYNRQGLALTKVADGMRGTVLCFGGIDDCHLLTKTPAMHKTKLVCMLHDIIPIRLTGYVPQTTENPWERMLLETLERQPHLIANSAFSKVDLRTYLEQQYPDLKPSISTLHLAHAFPSTPAVSTKPIKLEEPFFLLVGDIRFRKNAIAVFRAYKKLLSAEPALRLPKIVCAGNFPPNAFEQINMDGELDAVSNYFVPMRNANNGTLQWLYENATALIYPSLYEGYGLPIGEALWLGTPVLASNATSIPEVGGDHCLYFDPASTDELAERIVYALKNPEKMKAMVPQRAALRDWNQVASELLQIVKTEHRNRTVVTA